MNNSYFSSQQSSIKDKVLSLDYPLVFLILLLGIISFFSMYSTEGGVFSYYTKNHIYRFCTFFIVFISLSFFFRSFTYWPAISFAVLFIPVKIKKRFLLNSLIFLVILIFFILNSPF